MKLRVLLLAYPLTPVGPNACGGTEQILYRLLLGLNQAPWRDLIETHTLAREGSCIPGAFESWQHLCSRMHIPLPAAATEESAPVSPEDLSQLESATNQAAVAWLREHSVDLVHNQGAAFDRVAGSVTTPVLFTLHLARSLYPAGMLDHLPPNLYLQCVSRTQQREYRQALSGRRQGRLAGWIRNGVALDEFTPAADGRRGGYLLYVGRICPEKGPHLAIELARRTGRSLLLLGQVYPFPSHWQYFEREIKPRLSTAVAWKPQSTLEEKRIWMAGAAAIVIPSLVEETSSLVAMEAAASGTPVIAFRRGALTETVLHHRTGFLCSSLEEMEKAVGRLDRIHARDCRAWAESCFDAERMVREYVDLYRRLARTASIEAVTAGAKSGQI